MAAKKWVNMNGSDDVLAATVRASHCVQPFYRYTMPPLEIKVEGTTKMIKTILTNIEPLSVAVARPVDYLVTYFGQEMSANSKVDKATGKAYVTGNMSLEDLQAAVYKFIREHVTCRKCNNPETIATITGKKKNATIVLICKSCGGKTPLDPTDRFVKYQVQHPPPLNRADEKAMEKIRQKQSATMAAAEEADAAAEGTKKKKKKKKAAAEEDEDEDWGDAPAEGTPEGKKKKKKKKKAEQEEDDDDDEDWCMDTSEAAVAARAAAAGADKMLAAAEAAQKASAAKEVEKAAAGVAATKIADIEVDDEEVDDIDDI